MKKILLLFFIICVSSVNTLGYQIVLESSYLKKTDNVLKGKLVSEEKHPAIYEVIIEKITQADGELTTRYQEDKTINLHPKTIILRPNSESPLKVKFPKKTKNNSYYRIVASAKEKKTKKKGIIIKLRKGFNFTVEGTKEIKKDPSIKIVKNSNKLFVTLKNNSSVKEDLHAVKYNLSYKHNSKKKSLELEGNDLSPSIYLDIYPFNKVEFEIPWPKDLPKDATDLSLSIK